MSLTTPWVFPQNCGGFEQSRTVIYMVLKAKSNDRRKNLVLSLDGFRGPWSDVTVYQLYKGLLATDHVILNHGLVRWTTPELAPPLLTTTPHQLEDVSALDRFNVHRRTTRRVFSGIGLEITTRQATI
ncbi:uncharacterized protein TNCV_3152201 [Trichonephila clavipes]|nr:uncharacterized protein TNCV_3152201 [Trichonephila clavipes]